MKLSDMKEILSASGIQLTRSLGQNFLHDGNQLRRIVSAAELTKSDKVLEIGPGMGPLTELLLENAGEVLAIEKDGRLVQVLRERFAAGRFPNASSFHLLHEDALDFLKREPHDWRGWKLVSNLPYSVASPILVELAQSAPGPERMVATLQVEVAKRLMAGPGDADYGVLTLLVQLQYEPVEWFKIPASCFFPAPEVDSGCVTLQRRGHPLLPADQKNLFSKVVKRGFSQRRKMMLKLLKQDWPVETLERAFAALQLSPQARAESLSLGQFVSLTQELGRPASTEGGERELAMREEIFDVVNQGDEVVGRASRSEVHRLGLTHRAVHVLVFDSAGRLFLQKRSMNKDRQPGLWDSSASGHVDAGEDYDACAVREVREELGVELDAPPRRLFKLAASPETDQEHVWVYRGASEGPFRLHPLEIERGGWFTPEEINRWMRERPHEFASALLLLWRRLCQA